MNKKFFIEKSSKTALVTGASSGLGVHFARLFASVGYDVVLVARREGKLLELKSEIEKDFGVKAYVFAQDLSKPDSAKAVYEYTENIGVTISALVNNAGFGDFGRFTDLSWDKQSDMIQVNITTLVQLTKLYLPKMVEQGEGKVLNVASIASFEPGPLLSTYYASKAYVLSFSEALAVELKDAGVKVCVLCPGPTDTGFEEAAGAKSSKLFENLKVARADKVAEFGFKKLMKGRVVAIPGFSNKLLPFAVRFAPRALVRKLVYKIQGARRERKD